MTSCECSHLAALHLAKKACRVNGCPCQQFAEAGKPVVEQKMRRVFFDIPDGYVLQVTFLPLAIGGLVEPGANWVVGESGPEEFVPAKDLEVHRA